MSNEPSQLRLFESPKLAAPTRPRRVQLDDTSWIEHWPEWLSQSEPLLRTLRETAVWEQRKRWMFTRLVEEPRLTAEYSSLSLAPDPMVQTLGAKLSDQYGVLYDSAWLNLYRDERDSTSWHADRPSCKRVECIVPVLSLGAARRFLIRSRRGGPSTVFVPAAGDLIVMGGRCQRDWLHAVPKQTDNAGPRISINFGSSWQAMA